MENFEREVLDRLIKIEEKLDNYSETKKTIYDNQKRIINLENDLENAEKRITAIEDSNKWLTRTTAGAVIASLVAIVFALVQSGIGV